MWAYVHIVKDNIGKLSSVLYVYVYIYIYIYIIRKHNIIIICYMYFIYYNKYTNEYIHRYPIDLCIIIMLTYY